MPTFRGATGVFNGGFTEEGIRFEEALSGPMFRRNPSLSWKYFRLLELSIRGKQPNAAHCAIVALESPDRTVWVATQNIDELHQRAGASHVIELHGNLRRILCPECDYRARAETFEGMAELPCCPQCQGILRPDIVLYDELLPDAALDRLGLEMECGFDVVFTVGTTSLFPYVTRPVTQAVRFGIPTVEVNPEETSLSDLVQYRLSMSAGAAMSAILNAG